MLKLDSDPIVARVEAFGGISQLCRVLPTSREQATVRMSYQRAKRDGHITLRAADRICVRLLQCNPRELYGNQIVADLDLPPAN